jgi:putative membrane protein
VRAGLTEARAAGTQYGVKRLLVRWLLLAVAVFVASVVCQALGLGFRANVDSVGSGIVLLIGVALLSFLNATLGNILRILTLPLSCITLGLFSLVVNAFVLWTAARLDLGFRITKDGAPGFGAAFVASILISIINGMLGVFLPSDDKD